MRTRLLLAGLLILALAGCTSGSTPAAESSATANPGPSTAPTSTPTPTAAPTQAVLDVKVTFDGETCTYFGPTVILDGTVVRFEYEPVADFGSTSLLVYGVKPGTTFEQMVERAMDHKVSDVPDWVYEGTAAWIEGIGTMLYTVESVKQGTYDGNTYAVGGFGLGCTTPSWYTDNPERIYHAALLTVAGP